MGYCSRGTCWVVVVSTGTTTSNSPRTLPPTVPQAVSRRHAMAAATRLTGAAWSPCGSPPRLAGGRLPSPPGTPVRPPPSVAVDASQKGEQRASHRAQGIEQRCGQEPDRDRRCEYRRNEYTHGAPSFYVEPFRHSPLASMYCSTSSQKGSSHSGSLSGECSYGFLVTFPPPLPRPALSGASIAAYCQPAQRSSI